MKGHAVTNSNHKGETLIIPGMVLGVLFMRFR